MTTDQIIAFSILAVALVLFAWGRIRYDLVAVMSLLAVVIAGLIPAGKAFDGFGHPAVITVACVLIISHALKNSGVVDYLSNRLSGLTGNAFLHVASMTAVVTVASAFMNNVGALALMLPVAIATCAEHKRSPAMILMPLAFGSILGGMTTLIGTPPNIIIANYRTDLGLEPYTMFDFSPVGVPTALLGLIFVSTLGWRLIPRARLSRNQTQQIHEIDDYLAEVMIPKDNDLDGVRLADAEILHRDGVRVLGFARGSAHAEVVGEHRILRSGDILIVKADPNDLKSLIDDSGLELVLTGGETRRHLTSGELHLREGVITPGSSMVGRSLSYLRRRSGEAISLVALARSGQTMVRRLRRLEFNAGDIVLLQGSQESLDATMSTLSILPLAKRELGISRAKRVTVALLIFTAAITAGLTGLLPLTMAFLAAILVYIATGILPVREIYDNIDWPVIVLLGAMIPVGRALENSGATDLVALSIVGFTADFQPWAILALVLVVTMFLSDIINNAATALVMAPIAVSISNQLGVNVDPFLMSVAVGASCAFLTPIGHQSNTLVMGPGGYAFGDYWRMGLPLEIIIVVVSVPLILVVWPL